MKAGIVSTMSGSSSRNMREASLDRVDDLIGRDRLAQYTVVSDVVEGHVRAGHDDHGNRLRPGMRGDFLKDRHAVEVGQRHVDHHAVEARPFEDGKRLQPIPSLAGYEPGQTQG